jgi:hypothetical protein
MPFAGAFANGFVLEKRTHFRGVCFIEKWVRLPQKAVAAAKALASPGSHNDGSLNLDTTAHLAVTPRSVGLVALIKALLRSYQIFFQLRLEEISV